jgi:hypothetical protein
MNLKTFLFFEVIVVHDEFKADQAFSLSSNGLYDFNGLNSSQGLKSKKREECF